MQFHEIFVKNVKIKNILPHIPLKVLISDVMDGPTIIYVEDHPMLMSMNQKFRTMMLIMNFLKKMYGLLLPIVPNALKILR